ncbi:conserved protein of unknown function [Ectopseudomonas oleovorans]|uniref:Uncharacterized protein n=1 Tax=Ectopseudomonas oleovorans TaxID=301 RepID=A0A653BAL2_ECTOL|nr:conserved protein of unknown function [Pseudomonas oleovorans]
MIRAVRTKLQVIQALAPPRWFPGSTSSAFLRSRPPRSHLLTDQADSPLTLIGAVPPPASDVLTTPKNRNNGTLSC